MPRPSGPRSVSNRGPARPPLRPARRRSALRQLGDRPVAGRPSPPFTATAPRSPTRRPSVSPTAEEYLSPAEGGHSGNWGDRPRNWERPTRRPAPATRDLRGRISRTAGSSDRAVAGPGLVRSGRGAPDLLHPEVSPRGATSKAQAHRAGPLDEASAVTGPRSGLLCGGGDLAATNSLSRLASSWAVLGGSWGRALLSAGLACQVPFSTPLRGWLGRSPLRRRVARPRSGPSPAPKGGTLRQWRRDSVLLPADDRDGHACSALRRKQGGGGGMRTAEARVAKLAWNGDLPR